MKRLVIFYFAFSLSVVSVFAQTPDSTPKATAKINSPKVAKPSVSEINKEKEELDKAMAVSDLSQKINALFKFTTDFPKSTERIRVLEKIVSIRAQMADEKLRFNDTAAGIQLFKEAIYDVPIPISDSLFADVVLQFPTNLFYQGQQAAAISLAKLIEEKISDNPKQLLGLATFYLGTEKAEEGKRLAQRAIELNESLAVEPAEKVAAYQTLGLANRLGFQLEESEKAYAKALELNPDSVVSKRSLAETKRSVGKSDEALALYRELTQKDANDISAQNGLILSLFDTGKQFEAEEALTKSLETNPNNLSLLVGAAYWYAAKKNGEKAVDYAQKAVAVEPRYTWAHIALARGLLLQRRPLEAEKTLLFARQYGKFPTLIYELATVRIAAGFFEEAGNDLWKTFLIKDGVISTKLAGRIQKEGKDFFELLDIERRSSIFESTSADSPENAERIKSLLFFYQMLASKEVTDAQINQSADEFVKGNDEMRTHRELYAANQLLLEKKSLAKVLELTQAATKGVDASLTVMNPSAAVLADELLESRVLAGSRNEVIVIPEIPNQTLSNIIRGRIEEISGWALFQQERNPEAIVRLKRAISILPEKSAWWRTSLWQLGVVYDSSGNSKEALANYVKSYTNSAPDTIKWSTIENLYRKINGNTTDLEKLVGAKPGSEAVAQVSPTPKPTVARTPDLPIEIPNVVPTKKEPVKTERTPIPTPISTPVPTPIPTPISTPIPTPIATPIPTPELKVEPIATPTTATVPKTEEKIDKKVDDAKESKTVSAVKPMFEPIIITVPPSDVIKSTTEKPADDTSASTSRPRVANNSPTEAATEETVSCLVASQDSISILNQGGNLGLLVGYREDGDISKIEFNIDKPNDISISLEPEIGKQSNRAFYIIKSISENKGTFTVTFTSPCGKKDILVRVR